LPPPLRARDGRNAPYIGGEDGAGGGGDGTGGGGCVPLGALLGPLPVAIIYSFFVEYYVSGLTGAVKE